MRVSFTGIVCFFILSTAVRSDSQWLKQGIIADMVGGCIEFKPSLGDLFDVQDYSVKKAELVQKGYLFLVNLGNEFLRDPP